VDLIDDDWGESGESVTEVKESAAIRKENWVDAFDKRNKNN